LFTGAPMIDFSQIEIPGTSSSEMSRLAAAAAGSPSLDDPQTVRDMSSPHDLAMLKERNPLLADALLSGSLGTSLRALQLKKVVHWIPISELQGVTILWCHNFCSPTQANTPCLSNPASKAGTRFTYPRGMEGWVDLSTVPFWLLVTVHWVFTPPISLSITRGFFCVQRLPELVRNSI